jgi:metallophosphoesterase superfamily enzyme
VSQRGKRIHGKCFIADDRRIIMPAFGSFTGSLSISSPPFQALFASRNFRVWMIGQRAIYRFPATRVR